MLCLLLLFAQLDLEQQLPRALDPGAIMMVLATQEARAGNSTAALTWLTKAADLRQGFDPSSGPRFEPLRKVPGYAGIVARVRRDNPPVKTSRTAYTSPAPDVITEGIAADPATGDLYVGSLNQHTIFRIRRGRWEPFLRPRQDGLDEPLGLAVSAGSLWVCDNSGESHSVLRFDLATARLLQRWTLPPASGRQLLNDLAVTPAGEAWVTDSGAGKLYHAAKGAAELAEVPLGRPLIAANGIAIAPGGKRLYVSCFPAGIVIVEPQAKRVTPLARAAGITLAAIDGLYLHNGKLYGIQNTWVVYRVAAWTLNAAGDHVEKETILERAGPQLKDPTTGVFLGDRFHFLANSELEHWKDGKLQDPATMRPVTVLAIDTK